MLVTLGATARDEPKGIHYPGRELSIESVLIFQTLPSNYALNYHSNIKYDASHGRNEAYTEPQHAH
jgi:hypothetical protein